MFLLNLCASWAGAGVMCRWVGVGVGWVGWHEGQMHGLGLAGIGWEKGIGAHDVRRGAMVVEASFLPVGVSEVVPDSGNTQHVALQKVF